MTAQTKEKQYCLGDKITLSKQNGVNVEYVVGSAIGMWGLCLQLPGIGPCGLYPTGKRTHPKLKLVPNDRTS
jgi:hypothetical protein